MNMISAQFARESAPAEPVRQRLKSGAQQTSVTWAALQDVGAAVAAMAGAVPDKPDPRIRNLPAQLRDIGGWQRDLGERAIDDLAAVMRPGVAALLAVTARGQDPAHAAQRLWAEFCSARDALLALAPEHGSMGPRRSA